MIYTFKRRRLQQLVGCMALAALAGAFLLVGASAPADIGFFRWMCWAVAAGFCLMLVPIVQETLTPGPILTIGPEGLTYQPFSLKPVPWSELAAVNRVRSPTRHDRDAADPARDAVMFVVRDPASIELRRGFGGSVMAMGRAMTGGGTQIMNVQAGADEIIAAISTYWRGEIPVVTPTGRPFPSAQGE